MIFLCSSQSSCDAVDMPLNLRGFTAAFGGRGRSLHFIENALEEFVTQGKKLILAAIFLVVFSITAVAADKNHATITLFKPTQVGSTLLAPGDYDLGWSGVGNGVKVTVSKDRKVLTTAPARVVEERNEEKSVSTQQTSAGSVKLTGVALPKVSFTFQDETANGQ